MTTDNQIFETTIPFQGFYCSIHDQEIDSTIECELEYYIDEKDYSESDVESWRDSIEYQKIFLAYSNQYVDFVNSELGLASLKFKELESPREYNFMTDRISYTASYDDVKKLYDLYINSDMFVWVLKDQFTSYDGFMSYYSNDVTEWKKKPLSAWDLNEIGSLLLCHWKELDIDEIDSLDYNMCPMSEIISNELPDIG